MNRKGFTLIELMVAIVVLGMILVVIYSFFFYQEKTLRRQRQWSELNIKGRKASTYIAREFRSIGYSASNFGGGDAFGIINGTATGISYSHDIYGATAGIVDAEDIHSITLVGNELWIDGDFACDNVASLGFIYIDTTDTEVVPIVEVNAAGDWQSPAAPIEKIEYTLRLYSTSPLYPDTVEYSGLAYIRNERP